MFFFFLIPTSLLCRLSNLTIYMQKTHPENKKMFFYFLQSFIVLEQKKQNK